MTTKRKGKSCVIGIEGHLIEGEEKFLVVRPQVIFKAHRIHVEREIASDYVITRIMVGHYNGMIGGAPIPSDVFCLDFKENGEIYKGEEFDLPTVQVSMDLGLQVRRVKRGEGIFRGAFIGVSDHPW